MAVTVEIQVSTMRLISVDADGFVLLRGQRQDEEGLSERLLLDLRDVVAIALWGKRLDEDQQSPLRMVKLALTSGQVIEFAGRRSDLDDLRNAWQAVRRGQSVPQP